jgi:excinuclease ABC subunit A
MYVLDEPSIGLHQRDNDRLLETLRRLRDMGNTVIVVEHDEDAIRMADYVVDMGPGAGEHGGQVIAEGRPEDIAAHPDSLTGAYLSGTAASPCRHPPPPTPNARCASKAPAATTSRRHRRYPGGPVHLRHRRLRLGQEHPHQRHPLRPRGPPPQRQQHRARPCSGIEGLDHFDKVINVDQSPIGRTPRSNPATYTGLLTPIRDLFSGVPEAKARGYGPGASASTSRAGAAKPARATA